MTEESPKLGLSPTLISNDFEGFFIVHSTIAALYTPYFEQFGALYMHSHDDKYPAQSGFEPGKSRLHAAVDFNEPLGQDTK